MKFTQELCDWVLAIMWGIIAGTGLKGTITAFGGCYGALWFFGFFLALTWVLSKIE